MKRIHIPLKKIAFVALFMVCASFLYLWKKEREKPIFHPFGVNWEVTDEALEEAGYNFEVFEGGLDVAALGKKVGDTLIYYCLEYDCITIDEKTNENDCVFEYANSFYTRIKLPYYDSIQVVKMIEGYGGKILRDDSLVKDDFYVAKFLIAYPDTSNVFWCTISKPYSEDKNYDLYISQSNNINDEMRQKRWERGDENQSSLFYVFRIIGYHIRKKLWKEE